MHAQYLYTAGYQGIDIATFVAELQQERIQQVVDVRELPLSRKKGFSKTSFSEQLHKSGIAYLHLPALGCPKPIRDRYRIDQDWDLYTRDFLAYLRGQRATVKELAQLSSSTNVCLVCFESDFNMCHRKYVAQAARRFGAPPVRHLTTRTSVVAEADRLVA